MHCITPQGYHRFRLQWTQIFPKWCAQQPHPAHLWSSASVLTECPGLGAPAAPLQRLQKPLCCPPCSAASSSGPQAPSCSWQPPSTSVPRPGSLDRGAIPQPLILPLPHQVGQGPPCQPPTPCLSPRRWNSSASGTAVSLRGALGSRPSRQPCPAGHHQPAGSPTAAPLCVAQEAGIESKSRAPSWESPSPET